MPYSAYLPEHMGSIGSRRRSIRRGLLRRALTLIYTAGMFGIDDTGMLKISWRDDVRYEQATVR